MNLHRGIPGPTTVSILVTLLLVSTVRPAGAQWYVSGSWGASEDLDVGTSETIQSFQLGLSGFTDAGRLQLIGGVPVRPSEDLTWGLAEAASSPFLAGSARRGFGLQPDLLARGFVYHDPLVDLEGAGGLLVAEPYVAVSGATFRARLGGGVRSAGTSVAGTSSGRTAGVTAADVRFIPAGRLSGGVRAEVLYLGDETLPHGSIGLVFDHDQGYLWAGLDRWQGDERRETGWYAGGSLDLSETLSARVNFGRTSGEPMFDTPARQTWSIALRYRFADRPGRDNPGSLPEYEAGGVRLRVPAEEASGRPSVGGSFNGWKPVPMTRSGDAWTITLELEPGYYEIAFVDETGRWFVPESFPGRRPDGMGGWVMTLVVS